MVVGNRNSNQGGVTTAKSRDHGDAARVAERRGVRPAPDGVPRHVAASAQRAADEQLGIQTRTRSVSRKAKTRAKSRIFHVISNQTVGGRKGKDFVLCSTYMIIAPNRIYPNMVLQISVSVYKLYFDSLTVRASVRREGFEYASFTERFTIPTTKLVQMWVSTVARVQHRLLWSLDMPARMSCITRTQTHAHADRQSRKGVGRLLTTHTQERSLVCVCVSVCVCVCVCAGACTAHEC